ncbi:hypothetical protein GVY41_08005 [Frigidibacter albus]|uniref:Uncharacterized protein n=1 Tax=Frigidibacter albus TaxID=1465486 RepID=A0A6L8VHI5_9RHOB|nr:hypothetical protein [Frigidibacter albus]MZQ89002.1 hypothetical protein [Frigidibacter albus]NBE30941.1 hypothetical protein [Frigidibacter albus]GGH51994.1 hypothetical protein GCM10011341_16070 [Frigidibacter albus]
MRSSRPDSPSGHPDPALRPRPAQYLALWAGLLAALSLWRIGLWPLLPFALALVALALHRLAGQLNLPQGTRDTAHGRLPPIPRPGTRPSGAGN